VLVRSSQYLKLKVSPEIVHQEWDVVLTTLARHSGNTGYKSQLGCTDAGLGLFDSLFGTTARLSDLVVERTRVNHSRLHCICKIF